MAFTVYEYDRAFIDQAVEPATKRSAGQAFGAPFVLASTTAYVAVVPGADMYLRISADGSAATVADHHLPAGASYGFPVHVGAATELYGIAA